MTQAFTDALSRLPLTRGFATTLARAHDYATQQSHREVTLEHLLLALAEDPEASVILQSSSLDLDRLRTEVSGLVGRNEDRVPPGQRAMPGVSPDLLRILEYSGAAARQSKRGREINGAIVLAAIVGDGKSTAAHVLRSQGLTFDAAIKALQRPAPAVPQPPSNAVFQPPELPPPSAPPTLPPVVAMPAQIMQPPRGAAHIAAAIHEMPRAAAAVAYSPAPGAETTEDILASVRRRIDAGRSHASRPAAAQAEPPPPSSPHDPDPAPELPPWPADPVAEDPVPVEAWTPEPLLSPAMHSQRSPPPLPAQPEPLPIAAAVAQSLAVARDQVHLAVDPPAEVESAASLPERPTRRGGALHPIAPWPEFSGRDERVAPQPYVSRGSEPGADPIQPVSTAADRASLAPASVVRSEEVSRREYASPMPAVGIEALRDFVPKSMRAGRAGRVDASIARSDLRLLARALDGAGAAIGQDAVISKALTVRLRARDGGAWVEPQSPDTIWVDTARALARDDLANWSWDVVPRRRGTLDLVLSVSARTIGADGVAAETAFPDRPLEAHVAFDKSALGLQMLGWLGLMLTGALVMRFSGALLSAVSALFDR